MQHELIKDITHHELKDNIINDGLNSDFEMGDVPGEGEKLTLTYTIEPCRIGDRGAFTLTIYTEAIELGKYDYFDKADILKDIETLEAIGYKFSDYSESWKLYN